MVKTLNRRGKYKLYHEPCVSIPKHPEPKKDENCLGHLEKAKGTNAPTKHTVTDSDGQDS